MIRTLVLYGEQQDPAEFDRYYEATHIPLAARIPGLRAFSVSEGPIDGPFHRIAALDFDSPEAAEQAMATPEGVATVEDVPNFATGPVTIVNYQLRDVDLAA